MRILFIVPSLKNAGPVIVVYDLVHLLIKRGHKCFVCYFDKIEELKFDCEVVQISMGQKLNFSDYDIVHTHGYRPQLYVFCINHGIRVVQNSLLQCIIICLVTLDIPMVNLRE